MTSVNTILVLVSVLLKLTFIRCKIQCLDHNGKPVDWFIVYKLPEIKESSNPLIREGFAHFYMDVNSPEWKLSDVSLNGTGHAIHYTVQQIYDNKHSQEVFHAIYNDEKPDGEWTEVFGHTKGDVCFDKSSGFWLVHSLPRFPPADAYAYPPSGRDYGQSFLCVSLDYGQLDVIGLQLLFTYPWIYNFSFPEPFVHDNLNMGDVLAHRHVATVLWTSEQKLPSLKGQMFLSFAKFTKFNADLYSDYVAPFLGTNLRTETWQNGKGDIKSYCDKFKVENIQGLSFPEGISFPNSKDHSKWAVSSDQKGWTCIGGINRQYGQFKRGGGTVCFNIPSVHKAFSQLISSVEKCP